MEDLDESTVIRAAQRPATFCYVPLNFFIVEAMAFMVLLFLWGFWALAFAPTHLYFMIRTSDDPYWLTSLFAWWDYKVGVSNKGLKGDDVVTFSASPIDAKKKDYADFQ